MAGWPRASGRRRRRPRILVEAESREQAGEVGEATLEEAARTAGLPAWPVTVLDVLSPDDEDEVDLA